MTTNQNNSRPDRYRVWIAAYRNWQPQSYWEVPPDAVALEPAERGTMSAAEATRYVEAFNRTALAQGRKIWAVAIRIALRYDGEPRPGQSLADAGIAPSPLADEEGLAPLCQASTHDRLRRGSTLNTV